MEGRQVWKNKGRKNWNEQSYKWLEKIYINDRKLKANITIICNLHKKKLKQKHIWKQIMKLTISWNENHPSGSSCPKAKKVKITITEGSIGGGSQDHTWIIWLTGRTQRTMKRCFAYGCFITMKEYKLKSAKERNS